MDGHTLQHPLSSILNRLKDTVGKTEQMDPLNVPTLRSSFGSYPYPAGPMHCCPVIDDKKLKFPHLSLSHKRCFASGMPCDRKNKSGGKCT